MTTSHNRIGTEVMDDENDDPTTSVLSDQLLQSPLPVFSRTANDNDDNEEEESEEVRRLAAALAPTLRAADELFSVPSEFRRNQSNGNADESTLFLDDEDDDDSMNGEVEALGNSEAVLRQELELAQDFSNLFGKNSFLRFQEVDDEEDQYTPQNLNIIVPTPDSSFLTNSGTLEQPQKQTHCYDDDVDETMGAGDMELKPIRLCTTAPLSAEKKNSLTQQLNIANEYLFAHTPRHKAVQYSTTEHCKALQMQREERGGWYSVSLVRFLEVESTALSDEEESGDDWAHDFSIKEYCVAMSDSQLHHLFVGLPDPRKTLQSTAIQVSSSSSSSSSPMPHPSTMQSPSNSKTNPRDIIIPLPVRTVAIRIRPDVLCGAVMEGAHHALMIMDATVTKRQGGHCQALVKGAKCTVDENNEIYYPPFFVDIRLATHRSEHCERVLLVRSYHASEDECDEKSSPSKEDLFLSQQDEWLDTPVDERPALHLRESCALIQHIEAPELVKKIAWPGGHGSQSEVQAVVSQHLVEHYRACPSGKTGKVTLPALNAEDFLVIRSSWRLVQLLWEELETRDLTYTTLATTRFGSFPSLPTLDVHYCSQIRRISRDAMIVQLMRSAGELEEFAREAELACANMITLLKPTFRAYEVDAPSLPTPKLLTAYQLDFVVSKESFGTKVQHALNEIQAWTAEASKFDIIFQSSIEPRTLADSRESMEMAERAVHLVLEAFHKQHDEEQSARLIRKNSQVMDRLSKMQAHQKLSIQTLENCSSWSPKAAKAAKNFGLRSGGSKEVPLLKLSIVVGRSTGICSVTANRILFSTQLIPVVGGYTTTIFELKDVEFHLKESSTSILNPLPSVISIHQNGREVYSFRPSIAGARLKSFLDVVKTAAIEDPLILPDVDEGVDVL
jgi:hypothetical protein